MSKSIRAMMEKAGKYKLAIQEKVFLKMQWDISLNCFCQVESGSTRPDGDLVFASPLSKTG